MTDPDTTTDPEPAPAITVPEELALLGQIMRRVDKLGPASKRWLADRLDGDSGGPERHHFGDHGP